MVTFTKVCKICTVKGASFYLFTFLIWQTWCWFHSGTDHAVAASSQLCPNLVNKLTFLWTWDVFLCFAFTSWKGGVTEKHTLRSVIDCNCCQLRRNFCCVPTVYACTFSQLWGDSHFHGELLLKISTLRPGFRNLRFQREWWVVSCMIGWTAEKKPAVSHRVNVAFSWIT